ncbi:low affinity iron permease family protein [Variovorax sp. Varisp62]|uniref:low affinity iron permease family protein n=1 Tax=Variovorax sp. Varisp62 TaxID=3243049 RepID=UPI0039B453DB
MDRLFASFANQVARIAGSPTTFLLCVAVVVVWAATGPMFGFSETWQLIINTGTTIVTFLMVFLIQNTQNRDGLALQTKLDELIRSSDAQDEFMGIEKLTDKELVVLHQKCEAAARQSQATLDRALAERRRRGHVGVPKGERQEQPEGRHRGMGGP